MSNQSAPWETDFPNEAQKTAYLEKIKSKLSDRLKPVIALLVKERFKPGDVTEEEAIELFGIQEKIEEHEASGKTHGFKSFSEFAAKQRGGE